MSDNIKNEVLNYLKKHLYGNLASINSTDPRQPHVSTVVYVNDGFTIYFGTSWKTIKFANIEKNNNVALTIDEDVKTDWMKITGLQIEGKASPIKEEDMPYVFRIYSEKFPVIKGFPPNPDSRFLKITPEKIWLIDYTKGFGHREYLEL
jgi:uncharacterized protein YhbP (UPF0306 family)